MFQATCPNCQKTRQLVGRPRSKHCSGCSIKGEHKTRKDWHVNSVGYLYRFHQGRRQLQHRVIMEQMLGRPLAPKEIVHHKDHNKTNNDPSNLELLTQSEHMRKHHAMDTREQGDLFQCGVCKIFKPRSDYHRRIDRPIGIHGTCYACRKARRPLPLYDYMCSDCGHIQYDELTSGQSKIDCPHCEKHTAEKLPSSHGGYAIKGNNSASVTPKGSKSFKRSK